MGNGYNPNRGEGGKFTSGGGGGTGGGSSSSGVPPAPLPQGPYGTSDLQTPARKFVSTTHLDKKGHFAAAKKHLEAAKQLQRAGNHNEAYWRGAIASAHKQAARETSKQPKGRN